MKSKIFNNLKGARSSINKWIWEIIYQIIVAAILFLFYSVYQGDAIDLQTKLAFFCNYMAAGLLINFYLLPKLYYQNRYGIFFTSIIILMGIVILIDELVLEQIYFPNTRGSYFPGILFSLLETLPIIIIFAAFKFAWDFNKKQKEINALKIAATENELQYLKSQINPHFLFNNLNNLYSYSLENSPKTTSIILDFSSVLRYMLYDCQVEQVDLTKEINHIRDYIALNELRIENRGEVHFESQIDNGQYTIAPLLLIVFIENAFKHATSSRLDHIMIDISIAVNASGELTMLCTNNFRPHTNANNSSKGIGLINVQKQLDLLYPKKHRLDISNRGDTFEVQLTMTLKSNSSC